MKELLEKLFETYKIKNTSGLCYLVKYMWERTIISESEYQKLFKYVCSNPPKNASNRTDFYWYEPYQKRFRIQWLKKHIKLNS